MGICIQQCNNISVKFLCFSTCAECLYVNFCSMKKIIIHKCIVLSDLHFKIAFSVLKNKQKNISLIFTASFTTFSLYFTSSCTTFCLSKIKTSNSLANGKTLFLTPTSGWNATFCSKMISCAI